VKVVEDPELEVGKYAIAQEGKPGQIVHNTDGTTTTTPAQDYLIKVGTKQPADQPATVLELDVPFTTRIVYDPTLAPGTEVVDAEGAVGKVKVVTKDGKSWVEPVTEAVQRVVRVGTKPADAEWTEEIPFKVVIRENPELTRDQSRISQEGQPGLKRHFNGTDEMLREPVDYIIEVGTKDADLAKPVYSPVALRAGQTAEIDLSGGHAKGNQYRKLDWPEGWEGTVDPATGKIRVTRPANAKPGTKVQLPIEVTDANGAKATAMAEITVLEDGAVATMTPEEDKGSSEKAQRCVANAFSKNSPILWLLPVALLGAVGYGVNEAFGPQIQKASAQINEAIRRNTPDFGFGGAQEPEWMRQINAQVDAINRQFAPVAKQLEPVGIALGVIGALALTGTLIAQACSEEGFDNGLTVLSSK